jgi:hypothetical protein
VCVSDWRPGDDLAPRPAPAEVSVLGLVARVP